ncbi:MAG: aldolase/citrate lyase family protein [Pseudomonadota bacterium]
MSRIPYDLKWRKKAWLYERPFVLGTFCQSSDPMVIEILSLAGFDFVVVDCEHGPYSAGDVKGLMVASTAGGIVPIVRVKQKMGPLIVEALDAGALGVLIPHVSRATDAREAVAHARYYPLGERGLNPYIRATGYSPEIFKSYLDWANENLVVIIQVEGLEGVKNIDEILQVPGVDIVFLGPYDLSQSLGMPGQVDDPAVVGKMEEVIFKAKEKKIALGTFVDDEDAAGKWIELGVRFMVVGYDTRMLLNGARAVVSSLKGTSS